MPIMAEKIELRGILPWSKVRTKYWTPESLATLRDSSSKVISETLSNKSASIGESAIEELMAHGLLQKAAAVTRTLVKIHPGVEKQITAEMNKVDSGFLLTGPDISKIPGPYELTIRSPHIQYDEFFELYKNVRFTFIQ